MRRTVMLVALLLFGTALSACTVVLPLAERALTPQPSATIVPTSATALQTALAMSATRTIPDVAALDLPNEQLEALGKAILEQDLLAEVAGEGPLTLLAPSDAAFGELDPAYVSALLEDRSQLDAFVRRHVVRGRLYVADLADGEIETLSGESLTVVAEQDGITIQGARVLQGDIAVPFGLVHVIDRVLPETVAAVVETATPEPTATDTAEPTATATAKPTMTSLPSPTATLTQTATALPAATVTLTPSRTASLPPTRTATALATATMTIPPTLTATPPPTPTATQMATATPTPTRTPTPPPTPTATPVSVPQDLMSTTRGTDGLSELADLLKRSGLDKMLREEDDLTLLAPADEAFAELSAAEYASLTSNVQSLRAWLERYILTGAYSAAQLESMTSVEALSGETLTIRSRRGVLIIGGTRVLTRDIMATNGIIHIVDTVVLP